MTREQYRLEHRYHRNTGARDGEHAHRLAQFAAAVKLQRPLSWSDRALRFAALDQVAECRQRRELFWGRLYIESARSWRHRDGRTGGFLP